ncbi:unnamed protein product [Strongylus vulgaris]|uniref:Uncharacterized protein n=1 Tax=Strongylus vulgaris TaxID=40348 RepID=A0A3P7I6P3_STRVU|nr:unnamed protein product [Strongylus vulgaris]
MRVQVPIIMTEALASRQKRRCSLRASLACHSDYVINSEDLFLVDNRVQLRENLWDANALKCFFFLFQLWSLTSALGWAGWSPWTPCSRTVGVANYLRMVRTGSVGTIGRKAGVAKRAAMNRNWSRPKTP